MIDIYSDLRRFCRALLGSPYHRYGSLEHSRTPHFKGVGGTPTYLENLLGVKAYTWVKTPHHIRIYRYLTWPGLVYNLLDRPKFLGKGVKYG
jgi:hypothetical protein